VFYLTNLTNMIISILAATLVRTAFNFFSIFVILLFLPDQFGLTVSIFTNEAFLARDSIYAIARSLLTPVRLSVCPSVPLSVTRVDQSKTVTVRITQPSPQSSPVTLVSSRGTAP